MYGDLPALTVLISPSLRIETSQMLTHNEWMCQESLEGIATQPHPAVLYIEFNIQCL